MDFTAFFLLTMGGLPHLPAQIISYSAGVVNSYFLNRKWTFQVKSRTSVREAAGFLMVNGLSLLVSSCLLFMLHDVARLNLWLGKLMATGGGIIVNFLGSRLWVFSENQKTGGDFDKDKKAVIPAA